MIVQHYRITAIALELARPSETSPDGVDQRRSKEQGRSAFVVDRNSSATGQPYAGTVFNPYDTSQGLADVCITNPDTAGNVAPDGIPDGFVTPVRTYKAVEVEISKSFNNGWQMRTNYRWSTLAGNYEGAFRNDNGQSDPSISSLFDFTPGSLNMLGNQFAVGFLNTDRRHIFNNFISYTFSRSFLRNLTLGTGVRIESGIPVNDLRAHPVYQNGGEIPVGGRGALGRTSTLGEGDIHTEYMVGWARGTVCSSARICLMSPTRRPSFGSISFMTRHWERRILTSSFRAAAATSALRRRSSGPLTPA